MNGREELILRCATVRAEKLGGLSQQAFDELVVAVRSDPDSFVELDRDMAFREVVLALERNDMDSSGEEFLSDEEYMKHRRERFDSIERSCERALAIDAGCLDAQLLAVLVSGRDTEDLVEALFELQERTGSLMQDYTTDAWDYVLARPHLRVQAAIARTCLETARFHSAIDACEALLAASPSDVLGARLTLSLAHARLEDEDAFSKLEGRFSHRGNAWTYLAHTILLYKLGRLVAARRALRGFTDLCTGGTYALLRPVFVDTYLPDRPFYEPGSFEESVLAVHEADPIIVDSPDFISWAQAQPGVVESAEAFARANGFDY